MGRVIKDLDFGYTLSGNCVTKIKFEDQKEHEMPVDIYGEDALKYVISSKDIGDEIEVIQSGKWMNIKYGDEKPSMSKITNNLLRTLKRLKDDRDVVSVDFMKDEAKIWFTIYDILFDFFYETLENGKGKLSKLFKENVDLTKAKQTEDPFHIINTLVQSYKRDFDKKYIACLDPESN